MKNGKEKSFITEKQIISSRIRLTISYFFLVFFLLIFIRWLQDSLSVQLAVQRYLQDVKSQFLALPFHHLIEIAKYLRFLFN